MHRIDCNLSFALYDAAGINVIIVFVNFVLTSMNNLFNVNRTDVKLDIDFKVTVML